jgi:hypothetical protein
MLHVQSVFNLLLFSTRLESSVNNNGHGSRRHGSGNHDSSTSDKTGVFACNCGPERLGVRATYAFIDSPFPKEE